MSSSDDDVPLRQANGAQRAIDGETTKSKLTIKKVRQRVGDQASHTPYRAEPGISLRNGPVEEMKIGASTSKPDLANGVNSKRKSLSNGKRPSDDSSDDEKLMVKKKRRLSSKAKAIESESESDDDKPLVSKVNGHKIISKKPPKASQTAIGDDEDSDIPLGVALKKEKAKIEKRAEVEEKALNKAEQSKKSTPAKKRTANADAELQGQPLKKKGRTDNTPASTKKSSKILKKENIVGRTTPSKGKGKVTPAPKASKGKAKVKEEEDDVDDDDEEEEEYRWWEDPTRGDGTTKWTTLEHNGVVFPPPYEPLPTNVKMLYDGQPVKLSVEAEEVAGFFGGMLNSTHNVENPTFQKNFFADFTNIIKETGGATGMNGKPIAIQSFSKCDFTQIFNHFDSERARKKALPAADKKAAKAEKDAAEAPYMYCTWDGRKQKVGNFRVEPPALFRGRGEHPKTGMVKKRVMPEQVTINIGKGAKVPEPPKGHKWKEIKHDQEGTWLAMWQENINGNYKYVMLAANSDVKGQSDFKKFEKARELKKHIATIRRDYNKSLKAERMADRQLATAVYLIDQFALRAGNEKGEDEAETVGCCSLKYENVSLKADNKVVFDFLGKDSIRFYDEVQVDPQVFKNLKIFKKDPKGPGDEIFDRLNTAMLNKHLSNYMAGLTAKVFRTYNASFTMSNLLRDMKSEGTVQEKIKDYNDANRKVAILCNHKRTVTAGHAGQMEKMNDRIKGLKYQQWRLKQMMIDLEPKIKKKKGAQFFELPADIDQEWVKEHQKSLVEEHRTKIEKKFSKENEKLAAEGQKEMKQKELHERLKEADELAAKFKKENKSGKVAAEGRGQTVEKLQGNVEKLDQRITNMQLQAEDKEDNKEVALGTSKINYIDPRLTVVFCKKFNLPIEKLFSKTLREKFDWAIKSAGEDWEF